MTVSVILPTFREKDNIADMIRALDALRLPGLEIIVADDHSPDGTADEAVKAAATVSTPVRVEQNPGPRGLSPSVVHGFAKASGDILVCMDADGQHRPEDLPGLHCGEGFFFSLVAASRGYTQGAVPGLLIAVASVVVEPGL